jgi:hypothetical protein
MPNNTNRQRGNPLTTVNKFTIICKFTQNILNIAVSFLNLHRYGRFKAPSHKFFKMVSKRNNIANYDR